MREEQERGEKKQVTSKQKENTTASKRKVRETDKKDSKDKAEGMREETRHTECD